MVPQSIKIRKTMAISAKGGSYLLLIDLEKPLILPQKQFLKTPLESGRYLYAGSAYGPGGLRARVSRHIKKRKPKRWHIDYVTTKSAIKEALIVEDAKECDFISHLLEIEGIIVPLKGFGSSDCKKCPSHFLKIPETLSLEDIPLNLPEGFMQWQRS
ncbi:MAG: GIY-YIG nuclease family protein [Rhodospirillales bacterium]|nr:GIY-YIG nuclease family protein [Rhodospirillales bacterium]